MHLGSIAEYLITVLSLGVAVGIAAESSHRSLSKEVEAVAGVILILAVISPLLSLKSLLPEITVPELLPEGTPEYEEVALSALGSGIKKDICERFSVDEAGLSVMCEELELSTMRARCITVSLGAHSGDVDYRRVREYVKESYLAQGGSVEVNYG